MESWMLIVLVAWMFVATLSGCVLALQQYHQRFWLPELLKHERIVRNLLVTADEQEHIICKEILEYHEKKLLPAITLLASQRIQCEPEPESEMAPVKYMRPQLQQDAIENLWDKVRSSY
jgi:hypothetical protein